MNGIFGWDLPPGVRASDLPGNRPADSIYERYLGDICLALTDAGYTEQQALDLLDRRDIQDIVSDGAAEAEFVRDEEDDPYGGTEQRVLDHAERILPLEVGD